MLKFVLRFGPLSVGLFFLYLSIVSARWAEPPAWSLIAPREALIVAASSTVTSPVGNGTTRTAPVVVVEWPPESGTQVQVPGLLAITNRSDTALAEEVAARYPAGSEITVRLVAGQPTANRQDLFTSVLALFALLFGAAITGFGVVLNRSLK